MWKSWSEPLRRDLIVQETGWKPLHAEGLIAAESPDQFVDETPTCSADPANSWRRGPVRQGDDAKLRGARERKRCKTGVKVEGRKSYAEINPKLVELAQQLSNQRPRLSLRKISAALTSRGFKVLCEVVRRRHIGAHASCSEARTYSLDQNKSF